MGLWLRIALLLPLAALAGCGAGTSSGSSGSTPVTYNLSGNWGASTASPFLITGTFSGALQFSNGSVTGTINPGTVIPYLGGYISCPTYPSPTAVTGTVDSSGNLTLTVPLGASNGTATITATIPTNPQTMVNGSYQIVGGACATPPTPITIAQYAPVMGTYMGILDVYDDSGDIIPGETIKMTAVLAQSTAPAANGSYPLTGTVTTTGACALSYAISSDGYVEGSAVVTNVGSAIFDGNFNPTASTIDGNLNTSAVPGCTGPHNSGTLTLQ